MIRIEAADLYQSCEWRKNEIPIGRIFTERGDVSCNNDKNVNHRFNCVNKDQLTATVTFVSPVDTDDNGNYQVRCYNDVLSEFTIAQINIIVMGKTSCYKLLSSALFKMLSIKLKKMP